MQPQPPLILTLQINEDELQFFDELRQKHFPADRNFIRAHITLFHALPNESNVYAYTKTAATAQRRFQIKASEPFSIGRGVAYKLESPDFTNLHQALQREWLPFLSPQDKQKRRPHITVQNKVSAGEAQKLLKELQTGFIPFSITATGLQLWEYLGGPWKLAGEFSFAL